MENEKSPLEKLKENYYSIKDKYNLPEFSELNEDFGIETIAEHETDFLIREIKKCVTEKLSNAARLIETLLNPANGSMFVFSIVKSLDAEDRKKLTELYKKLSEFGLESIILDLESSEKDDAELVKRIYEFWNQSKHELVSIFNKVKEIKENKSDSNNKGYFG
ncbi:MAG TPA: hypothetical protein PLK34_01120 [Candidatus Pacearchaeota archaeon]|nr:hypothetical protein [Candidatus Pacearchaeota archaeon]